METDKTDKDVSKGRNRLNEEPVSSERDDHLTDLASHPGPPAAFIPELISVSLCLRGETALREVRRGNEPGSVIYQLKVTLQESDPPIWRRILVPASTTLGKLHDVLQVTMGWMDCHLHQFMA